MIETVTTCASAPDRYRLSAPPASAHNDNDLLPGRSWPSAILLRRDTDVDNRPVFALILRGEQGDVDRVVARFDEFEAIAEWRAFGARLNLPLLIEDQAGARHCVFDPVFCTRERVYSLPRRSTSTLWRRRPRFLVKRQVGRIRIMQATGTAL